VEVVVAAAIAIRLQEEAEAEVATGKLPASMLRQPAPTTFSSVLEVAADRPVATETAEANQAPPLTLLWLMVAVVVLAATLEALAGREVRAALEQTSPAAAAQTAQALQAVALVRRLVRQRMAQTALEALEARHQAEAETAATAEPTFRMALPAQLRAAAVVGPARTARSAALALLAK
jgi:hypothetical protein